MYLLRRNRFSGFHILLKVKRLFISFCKLHKFRRFLAISMKNLSSWKYHARNVTIISVSFDIFALFLFGFVLKVPDKTANILNFNNVSHLFERQTRFMLLLNTCSRCKFKMESTTECRYMVVSVAFLFQPAQMRVISFFFSCLFAFALVSRKYSFFFVSFYCNRFQSMRYKQIHLYVPHKSINICCFLSLFLSFPLHYRLFYAFTFQDKLRTRRDCRIRIGK